MKYNLMQRAAEYDRTVLSGATPTIVYTQQDGISLISRNSYLWQDIVQWLFENCVGPYSTRYDAKGHYMAFARREDAMLFKLVWL